MVRTIPVKSAGNVPQGLNSEMRRDRLVFATGARTNRTFVFDLRDPRKGTLIAVDDPGPDRPLVRAARRGDGAGRTGRRSRAPTPPASPARRRRCCSRRAASACLGDDGGFVQDVPARDPAARGFIVAPAGIAVSPTLRQIVTTSEGHGFAPTARGELVPGMTVQRWSIAGPAFMKNLILPAGPRGEENLAPRTPAFFHRKPSLVVNAYQGGGIFVSETMDLDEPLFLLAKDYGAGARPDGAAITPDDRFYVTALAGSGRVVSLSISDVHKVREVSSVPARRSRDATRRLRMSLDGRRIAVSRRPAGPARGARSRHRPPASRRLVPRRAERRCRRGLRPHAAGRTARPAPARPRALLFVAPGG